MVGKGIIQRKGRPWEEIEKRHGDCGRQMERLCCQRAHFKWKHLPKYNIQDTTYSILIHLSGSMLRSL